MAPTPNLKPQNETDMQQIKKTAEYTILQKKSGGFFKPLFQILLILSHPVNPV